jgi:hypothetical protein
MLAMLIDGIGKNDNVNFEEESNGGEVMIMNVVKK